MLFLNILDLCNQAVPTTVYEHAQEYVHPLYTQVINSYHRAKKENKKKLLIIRLQINILIIQT